VCLLGGCMPAVGHTACERPMSNHSPPPRCRCGRQPCTRAPCCCPASTYGTPASSKHSRTYSPRPLMPWRGRGGGGGGGGGRCVTHTGAERATAAHIACLCVSRTYCHRAASRTHQARLRWVPAVRRPHSPGQYLQCMHEGVDGSRGLLAVRGGAAGRSKAPPHAHPPPLWRMVAHTAAQHAPTSTHT
jgi:hypothetical protein